jgi:hypothetical protein
VVDESAADALLNEQFIKRQAINKQRETVVFMAGLSGWVKERSNEGHPMLGVPGLSLIEATT